VTLGPVVHPPRLVATTVRVPQVDRSADVKVIRIQVQRLRIGQIRDSPMVRSWR
jgi:hypothetical protein